jgi:hypothetical protein
MSKKLTQALMLCLGLLMATISFAYGDPDIHGVMQNNYYNNSVLGFSIKLPENWKIISTQQEATMSKRARQITFGNNKNLNAMANALQGNIVLLFGAGSNPGNPENSGIAAKAIKVAPGEISANSDVLEQTKFALTKLSLVKPDLIGPIQHMKIGDIDFATMAVQFRFNAYTVNEIIYTTIRKNYVLMFAAEYHTNAQKITLEKTFDTLLFY